jgi:type VI protein secretion system component Hcp
LVVAIALVAGAAALFGGRAIAPATAQTASTQYSQEMTATFHGTIGKRTFAVTAFQLRTLRPDGGVPGEPASILLRVRKGSGPTTAFLVAAMASGRILDTVTLTVKKNGTPVLTYELTQVLVEAVVTAGTKGTTPPEDVLVAFNPAKFQVTVNTQSANMDGGGTGENPGWNWNIAENMN